MIGFEEDVMSKLIISRGTDWLNGEKWEWKNFDLN